MPCDLNRETLGDALPAFIIKNLTKKTITGYTFGMAIFAPELKTFSRRNGDCMVAAAAYRSGEKYIDERTGEVYDYRKKKGIVSSAIFLPKEVAEDFYDRGKLWNAAEKAELSKVACVGRDFVLPLPYELSTEANIKLANIFGKLLVERYTIAVDVCIHKPHTSGDTRNIHAHVLMSSRRCDYRGFTEKTRELDTWPSGRKEIEWMRKTLADLINKELKKIHVKTVDHRSYQRQGLSKRGGVHLGKFKTYLKRRTGMTTSAHRYNKKVDTLNKKVKALNDLFTELQLNPYAKKYGDRYMENPEAFLAKYERVRERIMNSHICAFEDKMNMINEAISCNERAKKTLIDSFENRSVFKKLFITGYSFLDKKSYEKKLKELHKTKERLLRDKRRCEKAFKSVDREDYVDQKMKKHHPFLDYKRHYYGSEWDEQKMRQEHEALKQEKYKKQNDDFYNRGKYAKSLAALSKDLTLVKEKPTVAKPQKLKVPHVEWKDFSACIRDVDVEKELGPSSVEGAFGLDTHDRFWKSIGRGDGRDTLGNLEHEEGIDFER